MSALGSVGIVSARGLAVGAAGGAGAIAGLAGAVGTSAAVSVSAGALFGLAYGTAIRVGYEQIYPYLFPPTGDKILPVHTTQILTGLEKMYDLIGGKAAHIFGIEQGVEARTQGTKTVENYQYVPQQQPDILSSIDQFFKTLTSQVATFNPLPVAHATDETQNQPDIELTIDDKIFLIAQINSTTSIQELMRMRNQYTDLNLIQVIEARIRHLQTTSTSTSDIVNTVPEREASPFREATTSEQEYNNWQANLSSLQSTWENARNNLEGLKRRQLSDTMRVRFQKQLKDMSSKIRQISNDYRHPNNTIRNSVLRLRQELASGNWYATAKVIN